METTKKDFADAINSVLGNDSELIALFNKCFGGE